MEAERVASPIDEAAQIVDLTLQRGAVGRPLLWVAVGLVGGGTVAAGMVGLSGGGAAMTAPLLAAVAVGALVAAWADGRLQAARWTTWTAMIRSEAVPALRAAVLNATPEEALQLGIAVAASISRHSARLPEPPVSERRSELKFLDGVENRDPSARILAWLAAEVCGAATDRERLVRCPFLMALKRAAAVQMTADG